VRVTETSLFETLEIAGHSWRSPGANAKKKMPFGERSAAEVRQNALA
jgi:hypothetical protein